VFSIFCFYASLALPGNSGFHARCVPPARARHIPKRQQQGMCHRMQAGLS
jgi:hypothetical protein